MKGIFKNLLPLIIFCISVGSLAAQSAISIPPDAVVNKSSKAVGYPVEGGSTKVDLIDTALIKEAKGEAKVEAKTDITLIEAKAERLAKPGELGTEFLTYVLWAVTPDGRTSNLGEILTDEKGKGELKVTTQLQTFSLIVTSEPYHSVRQPSELVVLENEPRKDTKGKIFTIDKYTLMRRNEYAKMGNPLALTVDTKNVPLQMYEARNAVGIAKSHGADKYAPEIYTKAEASLKVAENLLQQNKNKTVVISAARQTMQFAEDSRALSVDRQEQERIAKER
jgi:hypothetical protein